VECPACWEFKECPDCGGQGEYAYDEAFFHPETGQPMGETQYEPCENCRGRGGVPVEQLR
jgi:DnaJ-class molecular chaperone